MRRLRSNCICLFMVVHALACERVGETKTPQTPGLDVAAESALGGADNPADLYVLSGQSNMMGLGKLPGLPAEFRRATTNCYLWNEDHFEPLRAEVPLGSGPAEGESTDVTFGLEVTFCHTLERLRPGRANYFVKYALSGQGLHHCWNFNDWHDGEPESGRGNFYPGTRPKDMKMGNNYFLLRSQFRNARAFLEKTNVPYRLGGVLWMHGEAAAKNQIAATSYAVELARLKKRLEQDLDAGPIPFVFGQVLPLEPSSSRFPYREEVRLSQATAHWDSGDPAAIQGASMVTTEGLSMFSDHVHFDADGLARLGERMAVAMVEMQRAVGTLGLARESGLKEIANP